MVVFLKYTFTLVPVYFLAWTAAYVAMFIIRRESLDFTKLFEYLGSAWMFRGGELPTFIWLPSIVAFLPMAGLAIFLLKRSGKVQKGPLQS